MGGDIKSVLGRLANLESGNKLESLNVEVSSVPAGEAPAAEYDTASNTLRIDFPQSDLPEDALALIYAGLFE
jgi:hypothetical protein